MIDGDRRVVALVAAGDGGAGEFGGGIGSVEMHVDCIPRNVGSDSDRAVP